MSLAALIGIDKERYDQGNKFLSQDPYLQNFQARAPITFNMSSPVNTGIMGPGIYPYPIIPQEGGDGGGGGLINQIDKGVTADATAKGGYSRNPDGSLFNSPEVEAEIAAARNKDRLTKAAQLGLFALNPMGFLMGKGISKAWNWAKDKWDNRKKDDDTSGGYDPDIHGPTNYGKGADGQQSYDTGQGFGANATTGGPVSNRTGRGRQDWAQGGRIGFGNGGLTKYEIFKLAELGYNTKGGTDLARFGGEKVLRDILRVNQYAYGGRAGYKDGYSVQDDMTDYAENVGKEANPGGGFKDSDDGGGNPPPSFSTNEPPKNLNFNLVKDINPAFNYRSNYGKLSGVLDTVRTITEEEPEGAIGYFSPSGTFGVGYDTNKGPIGTANLGNLNLGYTGTGGPTLNYQGSFGDGSGRFGASYNKDAGFNIGVNYHKTFNNGGIVGLYR